jgi:polyisoprenoid-binding protein YceI
MSIENWKFDTAHSSLNFWVRHLMLSKVHGRFTRWTGSLAFDAEAPESSRVEVEIDVASIDTREPQRDAHLRSADFFDAEKFPALTFVGTGIERSGDNEYKLTGELTMHGVTKPVSLDVEYIGRSRHPTLGERVGFSAKGALHRKDWGLTYNQILEAGGLALGDKVDLQLEIEVTKVA